MIAKIGVIIGLVLLSIGIASGEFDPSTATPAQKESIAAIEALGAKLSYSQGLSVDLSATMVTDAELAHLVVLAELESLNLGYTDITDARLAHLEGLTKLGSLDLSFSDVTDAGLPHLEGMTELARLNLSATAITAAGLVHLEGLTKLRELFIPQFFGDRDWMKRLKKALPNCRVSVPRTANSVDLDDGRLTLLEPADEAPKHPVERQGATRPLAKGKSSASVVVDRGRPRTEEEKSIEAIRKLGGKLRRVRYYGRFVVDFGGAGITDADLVHLKELKGILVLDLSGTKITDAGLDLLHGSGTLKSVGVLILSGTDITSAGLSLLGGATQLKTLGIGRTKIGDDGLGNLAKMIGIRSLNLSGTNISNAGLAHLQKLIEIRSLDLSDTKITDEGLGHLKWMTNLHSLDLCGTEVSDAGLAQLEGLTGLLHRSGKFNLFLDRTSVTFEGKHKLRWELFENSIAGAGVGVSYPQPPKRDRNLQWLPPPRLPPPPFPRAIR